MRAVKDSLTTPRTTWGKSEGHLPALKVRRKSGGRSINEVKEGFGYSRLSIRSTIKP
jgi:hypothetical protein